MPNDRRGKAARAEMAPKGYLQTAELAEKLTREMGRTVTVSALRGHICRGRIKGVWHQASGLWFFKSDTTFPERKVGGPPKLRAADAFETVALGPWATWPAPGFVRMGGRSYQLSGRRDWGWLGG